MSQLLIRKVRTRQELGRKTANEQVNFDGHHHQCGSGKNWTKSTRAPKGKAETESELSINSGKRSCVKT